MYWLRALFIAKKAKVKKSGVKKPIIEEKKWKTIALKTLILIIKRQINKAAIKSKTAGTLKSVAIEKSAPARNQSQENRGLSLFLSKNLKIK